MIFEELVKLLKEKQLHLSAAESCTGGLFMSSVIDIPGTSSIVDGSFVTYSAEMKTALVGVDPGIIEKYGVVSEEVAAEMAQGAAARTFSQAAVGITGNAGPTLGDVDKELGMVCFAAYLNGVIVTDTCYFEQMTRTEVRRAAAEHAAKMLIERLENENC